MRILVISHIVPYPVISGGAVRLYNLLQRIAARHEVWLGLHLSTPEHDDTVEHMERICNGVVAGWLDRKHPLMHVPGLVRYALAGWPLEFKFHYSPELARQVRALCATIDFDIVQIEEVSMVRYLEEIPSDVRARRVVTMHNIESVQYDRIATFTHDRMAKLRLHLYSWMIRRWEPRCAEQFDRCITVSEDDRDLLLAMNPHASVTVVPNGVDTRFNMLLPPAEAPAILFVGAMDYLPCVDAMLFFCRHILPRIRRELPDVELWIVGSNPLPEIQRLAGDGIHVTGRVPDVRPYYASSAISVVPLRAGGGTRLKILESMALGRPVVSTTIGCEGLDVVDGQHLLVADRPAAFAAHVVQLLSNMVQYQRIRTNARRLVEACYDWDALTDRHLALYDELVSQTSEGVYG
jgi:polysaccharide biosynthesis protein PslH